MRITKNGYVFWENVGEQVIGELQSVSQKEDGNGWYAEVMREGIQDMVKLSIGTEKQREFYEKFIAKWVIAEVTRMKPKLYVSLKEWSDEDPQHGTVAVEDTIFDKQQSLSDLFDEITEDYDEELALDDWLSNRRSELEKELQIIKALQERV